MEKFSYALEFYNRSLYSLDDTNLFKRKIKPLQTHENLCVIWACNPDDFYVIFKFALYKCYKVSGNFLNAIGVLNSIIENARNY